MSVKRPFRIVGKSRIFEGVCGGFGKSRYRARYLAKGEPPPTPVRSDRGHPRSLKDTIVTRRREVLAAAPAEECLGKQPSEKKLKFTQEPIAFNDDDLEGTI